MFALFNRTLCSVIMILIIVGTSLDVLSIYKILVMKNNNIGEFQSLWPFNILCIIIILCVTCLVNKLLHYNTKHLNGLLFPFRSNNIKRWLNNQICMCKNYWLLLLLVKFLFGFSAYKNTKLLFSISPKGNSEMLHCLNGIRFISITWIILGHVFGNLAEMPTNNYFPYLIRVGRCFSDVATLLKLFTFELCT
jgi:hypothetical protein